MEQLQSTYGAATEEKLADLWCETLIKVIDAGYDSGLQQKSLLSKKKGTLEIQNSLINEQVTPVISS